MSEGDLVSLQHTLYESHNPTRRWLHCARRDWISAAVHKYSRRGTRALEIGPGSGVYVPVLKDRYPEVHLADCEAVYLEAIEERYGDDATVKFTVDDITKSRLPANHFDLVLCTEVIEHISDSAAALHHIARIMKPEGILILSTPQRYSLLELTAKLALSPVLIWFTRMVYREPVLEMGHINLMTESTLKRQMESAGLRIVDEFKSGLYLPGIAECLGTGGQRFAAFLERHVRGTKLDGILWTQYYAAVRGAGSVLSAAS